MKAHVHALLPLALITSLVIAGPLWREDDDGGEDAGSTPDTAQGTDGVGQMQGLSGRLEGLAGGPIPLDGFAPGPIPDDFQDVFIICIDDPDAFVASTCTGDGFSEFDARLYLFSLDGFGIVGNNMPPMVMSFDNGPPCPGAELRNAATDATGSQVIASGLYLLAITVGPFTPLGPNGEPIFFFSDPYEISGPDGPDGGLPLTEWMDGTGACCIGGQCTVTTEADCHDMKGEYQGEDVLCDDVMCVIPVGACYLPYKGVGSGECIVTTEDDCTSMDGSYEGDGTECPPVGACIVSYKGTYCFVGTEDECDSNEGEYQGDGTECPPTGACLLVGESEDPLGYCIETTEKDCLYSHGIYQGDGTDCNPPDNDDCADAYPISDGSYPFDNIAANTDGPGIPPGVAGDCNPQADIWYEYFAPFDGILTVSTCNEANFDTVLAIYEGCDCPLSSKEEIACNDDAIDCGATSIVTTFVSSGACYRIRVGGWSGDMGTGTLTVDTIPVVAAAAPAVPVALGGDTPEADGEYTIIVQGVCFATSVPTGACELPDKSCLVTTEFECLRFMGFYQGNDTVCATVYRLGNHPDGSSAPPAYGLRLDELIDLSPDHEVFSFDFEAEGCEMFVSCTEDEIHIFGTAFGGLDRGIAYDPLFSGFVEIDFLYNVGVQDAPGDDDKIVVAANGSNGGTITFVDLGLVVPLTFHDYAGNFPYTFRLGDEDDDMGHRGAPGLSGWGWLVQPEPDSPYQMSADWLFRAELLAETAETTTRPVRRAPAVPSGNRHSERAAR